MVKAQLQAEIAPLNQQIRAANASGELGAANAANAGAAAAGMLGNIAPNVQQTYETAANDQSAFGKGFSQAMQDTLTGQDNSLNALLDRLNNPGARLDPSKAAAASDALYGIGGYIPATTFSNEGAAQVASAQKLPAIAELQGEQNAAAARAGASKQVLDLQNQIATAAGKAPSLIDDLYNKLVGQQQAQQRIDLQAQNDSFNQKAKVASLKLEAQKFAQQTLNQNRDYQLALTRIGISEKSLQLRTIETEYKFQNGGFTPAQVAKFTGDALTGLDQMPAGTTYAQYIRKAQEQGVPLSIAQKVAATNPAWAHHAQITLADAGYTPSGGQPARLPQTAAVAEIRAGAQARNLDPLAVLAIAGAEGLGGGIGDNGTSFGPFQLHIGGALPAAVAAQGPAYADAWAWSPAGINYALDQMAKVAGGLTGHAAIAAIATRFERPLNSAAEIAKAQKSYGR